MNLNSFESNLKLNDRDLVIFILPIMIFSLYLFMYNPGVLTAASFNELHQIATGEFTSACPILHTIIVMLLVKIFKTPLFMGVFQIIIFAAIWMAICKYHRDDASKSTNQYFIQFIITLIICLIPINAVYSVTLSSNVLFSYSVLFLSFLIKVLVDRKGQISTKFIIILALTLAIMSGLNSYGIIIALLTLIAIAYYLLKNSAPKNNLIMLIGAAAVLILLVGSLNFIFDVSADQTNIKFNDAFEDDINLEGAKDEFFSSVNDQPKEEYEKLTAANAKNSKYDTVDSYVNMFKENFILDGLFNNPILYMIFSVILLGLIVTVTNSKGICLVYVPTLANAIVAIFTGQNNMYANLLVFYLIAVIFISICFKLHLRPGDFANLKPAVKKPEKIEVQPKFEEVKTPAENNYYSDLESELEELTLDDINEMLGKDTNENVRKTEYETSSDLIDEILKEIEEGKE